MNEDVLRLREVSLSLRGERLFAPLTIAVPAGRVVTVMGPSGSGKSSLLALISGFLDPAFSHAGEITIGGTSLLNLPAERRRVGILFQDDLLFPHLSVGGNLAFGLAPGGSRAERRARVAAALAEAGLSEFAERDPASLSGGQRARVALMRTLLAAPRALLLDEPFGKLDQSRREDMRRFVFEHARGRGLPVLLVTHDREDAAAAQGEVVTLERT
jgi:putative thiamine transport system ATP-binding protein